MYVKKVIYMILGCLGVVLGALGAALPMLPTVPFFIFSAFCFAKSSQRLHTWFTNTQLYQKNLNAYVNKKGMTIQTKRSIITIITITMGIGFLMMERVPIARMILGLVWVAHLIYFIFRVKTISEKA